MPDIKKVLNQNKEITEFISSNNLSLENNLIPLYSYYIKKKICNKCTGLNDCQQTIKGEMPQLDINEGRVISSFVDCSYKKEQDALKKRKNNLQLVSCSFDNYQFDNVINNNERKSVLLKIKQLYDAQKHNKDTKGVFAYGSYGCGKTYLLAYLATRLADLNKTVIFAYYPDLIRQIKSSINTGDLELIVDELKSVDVLILDDFGGEQNTDFIRDEVLGVILNERINSKKLTCMTSNLEPSMLLDHISNGNKEIDNVKASRIYERISTLMDFIFVEDQNNYRK